jgi:hypothetical protein
MKTVAAQSADYFDSEIMPVALAQCLCIGMQGETGGFRCCRIQQSLMYFFLEMSKNRSNNFDNYHQSAIWIFEKNIGKN